MVDEGFIVLPYTNDDPILARRLEVRVVEEFPLNSTGKIAKKELRAQLEQGS